VPSLIIRENGYFINASPFPYVYDSLVYERERDKEFLSPLPLSKDQSQTREVKID